MKTFIRHAFPKLQRADSSAGRTYQTPTGQKYPSVTSVVGLHTIQHIMEWRQRVGDEEANKVSARASKRGTAIHALCEKHLLGESPTPALPDYEMWAAVRPALDRIDHIHCLESQLYSHHLEVAGTVDCIAEFDGKISVIDFKTSARVKTADEIHTYFMQTAAYAVMFEEHTKIPVNKLVIIMGVDNEREPLIFTEKRNNWIFKFREVREEYRKIKGL